MSTRTKGRNNEKEYGQMLKDKGYFVEITPPTQRHGRKVLGEVRQDLWGLFDVVGIAKKEILFVQVKTNLKLPKDISKSENKLIRDIREFKNKYEIKQARYVIAVRFDGNAGKKVEWIEYEI